MVKHLPHAEQPDSVVERYMRDVDRTLLRRNLALSPKDLEAIAELRALLEEGSPKR